VNGEPEVGFNQTSEIGGRIIRE